VQTLAHMEQQFVAALSVTAPTGYIAVLRPADKPFTSSSIS
jgi:hypothetical protein